MKNKIYQLLKTGAISLALFFTPAVLRAQIPTCDPSVPFYQVNLSGSPDSIWFSPGHARDGNCCGTVSPDRCTSFEVILDTGAAMINFNIASGAIPTGSMFYQIGCGPPTPVGQPICIVGPGPHHVTFCKPGNNQNTYMIQSIPKPTIPKPQHVRIGCEQNIKVLGLDTNSVTWNSVYPGTPGQYNAYLSCTSACTNPLYTPATNAPAYIIYEICGTPIATACGYVAFCDTFRVYNHPALTATVSPNPAGFCASGTGVVLTASASGGYGAYTYIWRDQSNTIVGTGASYTATNAGIYSVEVRDALYNSASCPSLFISVPVTVTNVPVVDAGANQTLCASSPTAYLNGSVQYATGAIWSGGAGTFNPSNTNLNASYTPTAAEITAGSVTLTLTSTGAGGGCANATDQVVITWPPQLVVALNTVNVPCNSATTILTPTITGGSPPYAYVWNTTSTNSSIIVGQGNYCVDVTDNLGCNTMVCANVLAPPALALTMSSTDVSVNGGSNGSATANPSGGTPPYSYSWSPGSQTTQTATGLSFGVYTVMLTDANGCSIYSSVVVNEPRCVSFDGLTTQNNVRCFGDLTGSATVNVSGGTAPYTYSWNDALNQTTAAATGLSAGTYIVVVTDANGCLYTTSVVITQPTQLTNIINHTNVTTVGGNNGSAVANPFGGTPVYTYNWSTGASTQSINALTPGTYTLTLTDNNNCTLIDSVHIQGVSCQNLIVTCSMNHVSCKNGSDGSATAVALHGTPPYSYLWSNGATTPTINNLNAGTYVVSVTDALNCVSFMNVNISEPSPLSIGLAPTHISCYNRNDGAIDLTVSGGTFPSTFLWSNGITVEDLVNLSDGTYSVTVTDSKGCTATASTTIIRPSELILSSTFTNVTCNSGNDGAIDLSVTGGQLPYSYAWNTGSISQDLSGLSSGQYSTVVTDANGCQATTPLGILIDEPESVATLSYNVGCPAPGSGVAQVNITPTGGWAAPYQVSFDNGVTYQSPGTYVMLLPVNSTYTVLVKDSNNCLSPVPVTISINPELSVSAIAFDKCYYDTASTTQVIVTPTGGNGGPYQVSVDGGATFQAAGTYSLNLPVDSSYSIIIKDSNNCVSVASTISLPAVFGNTATQSDYNTYNISCFGLSNGSIQVTTNGGTAPYTYTWSTGAVTGDVSGLAAGTYSVIVADGNNCKDTLAFTLTQPGALTSTVMATDNYNGYNIRCNGMSDGGIDLSVSGGVTGYSYQWSNGASTEDVSGIAAGNYSVIITDANNCTDTASITLSEPTVLNATISIATNYNGYNVSCFGLSDAGLNLQVTGGVQTYSYSWSNGSTSQNLAAVPAGTYQVIITDQNNCTDTASIAITEPAELVSTIVALSDYNGYNISCYSLTDGSVDVNVSGGVPVYSYAWSDGMILQDATNLAAGSYSVVITDANGCKDTLAVTLNQPSPLTGTGAVATDFNGFSVSCFGSQDAAITLAPAGGVAAYSFSWSNGATTQNLANIGAGTYVATITDQNGCAQILRFAVTEPTPVLATANIQHVLCNGFKNGSIDQIITGGVLPYQYAWSNNATTEDISGIGSGTYAVAITDANNCLFNAVYTVTETSPIVVTVNSSNVSCNGAGDAIISTVVSGGTPVYAYQWSNGSTQSQLVNMGPGVYAVTISDANLCTSTHTVNITEPAVLTGSVSSPVLSNGHNVSFYHSADGSVNASINGGTAPYSYNWSNGAGTANLNNVPAGGYTLTVTDQNGCVFVSSVVLTEPMELAMPTGISPNGDGLNDNFVVRGLEAYPDNNIAVFNRWGNNVYEQDKYANNWQGKNNGGADLPDGTYFVILKINNGEITLTGYVDVRR